MLDKINILSFIIETIFYKLVYMSVIASSIGIMILIIRKIFSKKISPKWISRLWLLVLVALICPIQISSIFSIYNYIPQNNLLLTTQDIPNISFREEYDVAKQETHNLLEKDASENEREEVQKNEREAYIKSLIIDVILPYLWLIVSVILIIIYISTYIAFGKKLNKHKQSNDKRLQGILDICKEKLKIDKKIRIIEQDEIKVPSLFGIFKIWILVPSDINRLTDTEINYIFMHELVHYKRKDNILKWCLTLIKYVYIFNPVIYIICKQIIKDMEVATDEIAVRGFNVENRKQYCKTLIKLTDEYATRNFVEKTLAISDNKNNLERRIKMIKLSDGFIKHKLLISVISIIVILALGFVFLTKPKIDSLKEEGLGKDIVKNTDILTEVDALSLGKEKFEKIKGLYWSCMDKGVKDNNSSTIKVKETDVKEIKDICTEKAFSQFIRYWDITVGNDGYYYFSEGIGANPRYISDELSVESITEDKITFINTAKYDDNPAIKTNNFILVKQGNNWLVDDFTSPY